jgi:hypothetical protein
MTPQEVFRVWAPEASVWSRWAKPVLFAQEDRVVAATAGVEWRTLQSDWIPAPHGTAIVVDMPGMESVSLSLSLAERGFRPVPLYNTNSGRFAVLNVEGIRSFLFDAAPHLARMTIAPDATPVFMLDAARSKGGLYPSPGSFDNRWVVFAQDFPSANFLLSQGIQQVLLLQRGGDRPQDDLAHVLHRWQEAGIRLQANDPYDAQPPVEMRVNKPSGFKSFLHRALVMAKFRRNSAGGFGGVIPQPSSGGGGFG